MMQRLFLARHGETVWNREDRLQGQSDTQLSETGKHHAQLLLRYLRHEHLDAIYTSSLRRAVETAKPVADHLSLAINVRDELQEMSFGELEGKSIDDPDPKIRRMMRRRLQNKAGFVAPGAESYPDVERRVFPLLDQLHREQAGRSVLIVAHRAVNRVILGHIFGCSPDEYVEIDQDHDTLYEVRFDTEPKLTTHTLDNL